MARYIDADALDERKFPSHSVVNCYAKGWNDAIKAVQENAPTIEARPVVRGRWIEVCNRYVCSVCKKRALLHFGGFGHCLSDFCPNCGADMRGEEDAV